MISPPVSVVAQLLYAEPPLLNFARLVSDLQAALRLGDCPPGILTWDCDDLAMLDVGGTRFLLSLATAPEVPCAACLSVSVGPAPDREPDRGNDPPTRAIDICDRAACERIVQRILRRSDPDRVLWHDVAGVTHAAVIDELVAVVPHLAAPRRIDAIPEAQPAIDARQPDQIRLAQARAALWPIDPAAAHRTAERRARRASMPLRLATHSMDATLLVAALPIGAAMITLSMVRGADTRLSARVMVLTGSVMAILGGPLPGHLAFG